MGRVDPAYSNVSAGASRGFLLVNKLKHAWGSRTLIMGIVNVTPDSFSGDGVLDGQAAALQAGEMIACGADIIDVGGESTRPGHSPVSQQEEMQRVLPVIKEIGQRYPDITISLDTTKAAVLQAAKGAHLLNSIWGMTDDLLAIAAASGMPVVIMHNKEKPEYDGDVVDDLLRYFEKHTAKAQAAGLKTQDIILDPGIGFGKTAEHNLQVLHQLPRFVALGFPTLLGTSRKSFIGKLTGKSVGDRLMGSAATVALAIAAGIDIVRVHDVAETKEVVEVSDAIIRGTRPGGWQ